MPETLRATPPKPSAAERMRDACSVGSPSKAAATTVTPRRARLPCRRHWTRKSSVPCGAVATPLALRRPPERMRSVKPVQLTFFAVSETKPIFAGAAAK